MEPAEISVGSIDFFPILGTIAAWEERETNS